MRQRKKTTNLITLLFERETPSLEKVLENPDLSISLRYEIDELVDFIVPSDCDPKNCPILIQILDYALPLSKKQFDPSKLIYYRNSASLLSTICNKLQTRIKETCLLKKRLEDFINLQNSEINEQNDVAGHFQRIAECFLRFEIRNGNNKPFDDCRSFLSNILAKTHILAYRFLSTYFFTDFIDAFVDGQTNQEKLKNAATFLSKYIASNKTDSDHKYYTITILFQIYQQCEAFFSSFNLKSLYLLLGTPLYFTNKLYIFDSVRIISLLISKFDSHEANRVIDLYVNKNQRNLINFSKKNTFNFCSLFRIFWEQFLRLNGSYVMDLFFQDPYDRNSKSEVNWEYYIKVVEVFSKLDSKKKQEYINNLGIIEKSIDYMNNLDENKIPNFNILKLIEIISQPLEDNEFELSIDPRSNTKNPMLNEKWVETVFKAKAILEKKNDAVEFAKKDFVERDDFFM